MNDCSTSSYFSRDIVKVSVITHYTDYLNNRIFEAGHVGDGAHSGNAHWRIPYFQLKKYADSHGLTISTYDLLPPEEAQIVVFFDLTYSVSEIQRLKMRCPKAHFILIIIESPLTQACAFDSNNHTYFDLVLTYNRDLKGKKYAYFDLPIGIDDQFKRSRKSFSERKLLVLMSTHQVYGLRKRFQSLKWGYQRGWRISSSSIKDALFRKELYSERYRVARYFEKAAPDSLDIYGSCWEGVSLFQGNIWSKLECLGNYRFNLAYENCMDDDGYISEKILDSLIAGTVPIYLGNKKISKVIPSDCFIDAAAFKKPAQILNFVKGCSEKEWINYWEAGKAFLESDSFQRFLPAAFSENLVHAFKQVSKNEK